jgi:hypothetical protein
MSVRKTHRGTYVSESASTQVIGRMKLPKDKVIDDCTETFDVTSVQVFEDKRQTISDFGILHPTVFKRVNTLDEVSVFANDLGAVLRRPRVNERRQTRASRSIQSCVRCRRQHLSESYRWQIRSSAGKRKKGRQCLARPQGGKHLLRAGDDFG